MCKMAATLPTFMHTNILAQSLGSEKHLAVAISSLKKSQRR